MNDKSAQFEKYLELLFTDVRAVYSKYELYLHLQNKRIDRIEEINIAPAFFQLVFDSLFTSIVVTLAKIYDNYRKKRSDRNLHNFLKFVENNLDLFPKSKQKLAENGVDYFVDINLINEHLELIEQQREKLDNLFIWRDKLYAHYDKKFFTERDLLNEEANLKYGDFKNLITLASDILNKYSAAYNGVYKPVEVINRLDVDRILEILHEHRERYK